MPLHRCLSGSRPWWRTRASLLGLQVLAGQEEPPGPAGAAERLPAENSVCPRRCRTQQTSAIPHNFIRVGNHAKEEHIVSYNLAFEFLRGRCITRQTICNWQIYNCLVFFHYCSCKASTDTRWLSIVQSEIIPRIFFPLFSPSGSCHLSHQTTSPVKLDGFIQWLTPGNN